MGGYGVNRRMATCRSCGHPLLAPLEAVRHVLLNYSPERTRQFLRALEARLASGVPLIQE